MHQLFEMNKVVVKIISAAEKKTSIISNQPLKQLQSALFPVLLAFRIKLNQLQFGPYYAARACDETSVQC